MDGSVVTIQNHIALQQSLHPEATGHFTAMLWDLVLAFKLIAREVRRAGLIDILGTIGHKNIHGEKVQKLDEYAQEHIYRAMVAGGHVACMASEERAEMMTVPREYRRGRYVLMYDPLDGSSNIDVNISIGTIFSIHKKISPGEEEQPGDVPQPRATQ